MKKILGDLQDALSIAQAGIKGTVKSLIKSRTKAKKGTARKRGPKKKAHSGAMPKPKPQPKKLRGKNSTDPILHTRSIIKAASGGPLTPKKRKKKTVPRKPH